MNNITKGKNMSSYPFQDAIIPGNALKAKGDTTEDLLYYCILVSLPGISKDFLESSR